MRAMKIQLHTDQGREYKSLGLSLTDSPTELSSASLYLIFEMTEQQPGLAGSKL